MYSFEITRLMVFTKEKSKINDFFIKYNHFFEEISSINNSFLIISILSKQELESLLEKHLNNFCVFQLEKQTINELLDKISTSGEVTLSDRKQLSYLTR